MGTGHGNKNYYYNNKDHKITIKPRDNQNYNNNSSANNS